MAVAAEARKMEKGEQVSAGPPSWVSGPLGWGPRKFNELKKVTWPSRQEVYSTTIVVIMTTVFFGFYLYSLDLLLSQLFTKALGAR
jgi:preprotein translocase SecE subunit